jgi:hypothetical protein
MATAAALAPFDTLFTIEDDLQALLNSEDLVTRGSTRAARDRVCSQAGTGHVSMAEESSEYGQLTTFREGQP